MAEAGRCRQIRRVLGRLRRVREIAKLLESISANSIETGGSEADTTPLLRAGVPGFSLRTVMDHYFDWHHTDADTFDKIDTQDFRKCIATFAVMAYVLADMPDRL